MYVYKISWTDYSDDPMLFVAGSIDEFLVHEKQFSQAEFCALVAHSASTYHPPHDMDDRQHAKEKMLYAVKQMKIHLGFKDFEGYEAEYEF